MPIIPIKYQRVNAESNSNSPLLDQQGRRELLQSAQYRVLSFAVPLPRLPFHSDSMVGAEIAGRSMPDEHTPVGPPPLKSSLPPAVPNTQCMLYECDTPVPVCLCFACEITVMSAIHLISASLGACATVV